MARVLVTGSTQGLGLMAAEWLVERGHQVVVHARNGDRVDAVGHLVDQGHDLVIGDLADPDQTRAIAEQVNGLGRMDAVIHNAGVVDGPGMVHVNLVAPYMLTVLIERPDRLVYLSSNDHFWGDFNLGALGLSDKSATASYADTKLLITTLAMAVAQRWPDVVASAVDPGWVPTRMGGQHAPDDLSQGHTTQAWLAAGEEPGTHQSGHYWYHMRPRQPHHDTQDPTRQDQLLATLTTHTGLSL